MSDIALSTLKKFEAFFKTLGMGLSSRPFAIVAIVATVALGSMHTAQSKHSNTPHVHVRDHRITPIKEQIMYLVAGVELDYKFSETPPGSTALPCVGEFQIEWGARAVSLEPETRYHAEWGVHGERGPIQETETYDSKDYASLGGDSCIFDHAFTELALGKWEFWVHDGFFWTTCLVNLKREDGKVLVKFTKGISECKTDGSFPSAATVVPANRATTSSPSVDTAD